ncbi:hypothetical protein CRYUN_Cryun14cG0089900 [Craigia yunnanensis]
MCHMYYTNRRPGQEAPMHSCSMALTWVLQQEDDVVPGTTKIKNLNLNIGLFRVKLTAEDLEEISDVVRIQEVAGDRNYDNIRKAS